MTGLAADGDTLYVTLAPLDTTQAGKVDRVAADGTVTDLVTTAVSPSLPTLYAGTLFYSDVKSGVLSTIEAVDLTATAPITPQDVVPNVQSPGAILDVDGLLQAFAISGDRNDR